MSRPESALPWRNAQPASWFPPPFSLLILPPPPVPKDVNQTVICFSIPNLQWRVEDIKELFIFGDGGIVDCFLNQTRLPWRCQVKYWQIKKVGCLEFAE